MESPNENAREFIRLNCRDFKHWKVEKFARYVSKRLLERSNVDLRVFQLHWEDEWPAMDCNDVRMWIKYAVNHNVKVLDVKLCAYDKTVLPPCIFTCRSLQELNLQRGKAPYRDYEHAGLVVPDIINLPSLKRLTVRDVEIDQNVLDDLIARSPDLEDLHLLQSASVFQLIASKVLKRLTVDGFIYGSQDFTICAPHLISFECQGCPLKSISWRDQPSLESACIDTFGTTYDCEFEFTAIILHAKKLALFGTDIKVMLTKELPTCSVFETLVTLEIGKWDLTKDFCVVLRFLQLSPRLENLILMHKLPFKAAEETDALPIDETTFDCPLLESVTIQCSQGDDGIDKLVNVLVAKGTSPDKINVISYEDIRKRAWEKERATEERVKKAKR